MHLFSKAYHGVLRRHVAVHRAVREQQLALQVGSERLVCLDVVVVRAVRRPDQQPYSIV